jgi:ABC-type nitrate/sulfonate/bicarbonate transport system ATPase subunit
VTALLELSGVRKKFGGATVLSSVSLKVEAGDIWLISGPSGLGKSVLLEIMAGILAATGGLVRRAAPVGFLFQDDALIPWLTAYQNLAYVLPPSLAEREAEDKIARSLSFWELAGEKYPAALSGGARRRLALARALILGRPLAILDEPFAFLDPKWDARISSALSAHAAQGGAAVLSGHSLNPILREKAGAKLIYLELSDSPIVIGDLPAR